MLALQCLFPVLLDDTCKVKYEEWRLVLIDSLRGELLENNRVLGPLKNIYRLYTKPYSIHHYIESEKSTKSTLQNNFLSVIKVTSLWCIVGSLILMNQPDLPLLHISTSHLENSL